MELSREHRLAETPNVGHGKPAGAMPPDDWQLVLVDSGSWEAALARYQSSARVRVVALGIADAEERLRASEAGAVVCVEWSDSIGDLVQALKVAVRAGSVGSRLAEPFPTSDLPDSGSDPRLQLARSLPTVLLEVALRRSHGATGAEIAAATHRSEKTVKTHFQRLNRRLGITSVRTLQD